MLERKHVDYPLWRKKVDASFLRDGTTPIPNWLLDTWEIKSQFDNAVSVKMPASEVSVVFKSRTFTGHVTKHKYRSSGGYRFRFSLEEELTAELRECFLMSYMRMLESGLSQDKTYRQVESEISFWEFIDIEFDVSTKTFYLLDHYTQKALFPELFGSSEKLVGKTE